MPHLALISMPFEKVATDAVSVVVNRSLVSNGVAGLSHTICLVFRTLLGGLLTVVSSSMQQYSNVASTTSSQGCS